MKLTPTQGQKGKLPPPRPRSAGLGKAQGGSEQREADRTATTPYPPDLIKQLPVS